MSEVNPYAPPAMATAFAGGAMSQGSQGWALDGDTLVVTNGASLPNLCLFDGSVVAQAPTVRKLYWAPPWVGLLVLLSPLIYIIVFMSIRKQGSMSYYLGAEAKRRRTVGVLLALGSVGFLIASFAIALSADLAPLLLVGLLGFLVLLILGIRRTMLFKLNKIDEHSLYLKLQPPAVRAFAARALEAPVPPGFAR